MRTQRRYRPMLNNPTHVIAYRMEWAKRMMEYRKRMAIFPDGSVEVVVEPVLPPGEKKLVLVTHDESTFYANDSREQMWLAEGENVLRKKSQGLSIMVSEFQCPCHGTMPSRGWTSRKFFCAGSDRDGWWKSSDMLEQLVKDAVPLFELLHPDCEAVFIFDQSSNHNAYAKDALIASRMTLKEKDFDPNDFDFRPGYFQLNGESYPRSFFRYEDRTLMKKRSSERVVQEVKIFKGIKGIKQILLERNLWVDQNPYQPNRKWKLDCGGEEVDDHRCCARHLLASQPDFKDQKTAICEAVLAAGHKFELYPKFHCECNWIERYWGAAKRIARINCDYQFKSLEKNLPLFLDAISPAEDIPTMIRKFYNRSWRFIEAYSSTSSLAEVEEHVKMRSLAKTKVYRSHRRVGLND